MSTIAKLWSEYWWVLPLGLMLACFIGCLRGRSSGRAYCCVGRRSFDAERDS